MSPESPPPAANAADTFTANMTCASTRRQFVRQQELERRHAESCEHLPLDMDAHLSEYGIDQFGSFLTSTAACDDILFDTDTNKASTDIVCMLSAPSSPAYITSDALDMDRLKKLNPTTRAWTSPRCTPYARQKTSTTRGNSVYISPNKSYRPRARQALLPTPGHVKQVYYRRPFVNSFRTPFLLPTSRPRRFLYSYRGRLLLSNFSAGPM